MRPKISVITPTTGKNSLANLINSVTAQNAQDGSVEHILMWDDFREDSFVKNGLSTPKDLEQDSPTIIKSVVIKGSIVQGAAKGSALRAAGLMIAQGDYVTFADDDVIWEKNHLATMLKAIEGKKWAFCKRRIWTPIPKDGSGDDGFEFLGVDNFESVGEEAKTPYKMVDNNCTMFERRLGTSAAVLYRETQDYNDDRLMYEFLKKYAGEPGKTNEATINQVCPERLISFFRTNCTR